MKCVLWRKEFVSGFIKERVASRIHFVLWVGSGTRARDPHKNHLHLHISLPNQESVHLADLGIGGVHRIGYTPLSKVLSTYTPMEELALAQLQPQPVIHRGHPQLCLHRRRHHVRHERLEVLDVLLVTQNRVAPREVFPKTRVEKKTKQKVSKLMMCCVYECVCNKIKLWIPVTV